MEGESRSRRAAQLDTAEREQLEDVVEDLRERVEDNVRFQLTQKGLDDEPENPDELDDDTQQLVEAIDLEGVDDHTWDEAFEKYVTGVGYTIVNRLAALRCMEVRDFVDEEVTVFKTNGLTPAAETLVHEEFLLEDEAILEAYHRRCEALADEIEILFDTESAYSLVDPDDDTFEELCGMLDEVPDEVWRADDVLGWVYEYYNRPVVEALDAKNTLEPDDVGPANQFYTPHWVVRMLADNSLGKLYLEATGQESAVPEPEALSIEERKERLVTPRDTPGVPELCTYLIPDEDDQDAPSFDHPSELRVIDPACGSGHFLLYAFDILERIWWAETDLDRDEIPAKILEHNLYGVDIDLRSCQLSAFNLYLKARTRAEREDGDFEMPNVGIVCADARVVEVEDAVDVLDQITGERTDVREALDEIIEEFQTTEALGSLLDVQSTLSEEFIDQQTDMIEWSGEGPHTLNGFLRQLREAVEERTSGSFGEQHLRSFLSLLVVLTQDYDVALMNPPYGTRGRMPSRVRDYVTEHYDYVPEYYINFFEASERIVKENGRVGMLVPWSFLFNQTLEPFRSDFIGDRGSFDFLTEFGYDILDNATVGTVGTVVRTGSHQETTGTFIRLHDKEKEYKESTYLETAFGLEEGSVQRYFEVPVEQFDSVPGTPICYSLPPAVRRLHDTRLKIDPSVPGIAGEGIGDVKQGLATGDNGRFVRKHWEGSDESFKPFTNAGGDVWVVPQVDEVVDWRNEGVQIERYSGSRFQNTQYYGREGLTWAYIKRTGRRFGHYPTGGIFGHASNMLFPADDLSLWNLLAALNSDVFHGLMLCLTPERKWEAGYIGRLPWFRELEDDDRLEEIVKEQHELLVRSRVHDPRSPYYIAPELQPDSVDPDFCYSTHAQVKRLSEDAEDLFSTGSADRTLEELARRGKQQHNRRRRQIESLAREIDDTVCDILDVDNSTLETIRQEIWLRTVEGPDDRDVPAPEEVTLGATELEEKVEALIHHLALRAVRRDEDGIIAIKPVDTEPDLLERLEREFEHSFGERGRARMTEADSLLGTKSADEEAYPNLREWLEDDLFDYHVSTFDRTPILWRLTTKRLVSDPDGEGFACLVDYHQLDDGVFDRLQNRYLDPRKALLRERRSAANRRRGDDSLSASEKAAAAEEYARCESGLEQIGIFEERLAELAQPSPREWPEEKQQAAADAVRPVADFRDETASRLETLGKLAELEDVDMGDLFSPSFYETVRENRAEWLDALDEIRSAFEAYAADGSEPVDAHRYDLVEYYDDLVGSAHYASNGILFMTYYFGKFEGAEQSTIGNGGVSERERLLSELATGLEEYEALANELSEACDAVTSDISADWEDRALAEITTAGYQPNRKHGVEINIRPLADAKVVPKTVEDDVL